MIDMASMGTDILRMKRRYVMVIYWSVVLSFAAGNSLLPSSVSATESSLSNSDLTPSTETTYLQEMSTPTLKILSQTKMTSYLVNSIQINTVPMSIVQTTLRTEYTASVTTTVVTSTTVSEHSTTTTVKHTKPTKPTTQTTTPKSTTAATTTMKIHTMETTATTVDNITNSTTSGSGDSGGSDEEMMIIMATLVSIFLIIVIVTIVVFCMRKNNIHIGDWHQLSKAFRKQGSEEKNNFDNVGDTNELYANQGFATELAEINKKIENKRKNTETVDYTSQSTHSVYVNVKCEINVETCPSSSTDESVYQNTQKKENDYVNPIQKAKKPKHDLTDNGVETKDDFLECQALYEYHSELENDLSFNMGDILVVVNRQADGWWYGCHINNDKSGWFPGSYVEIKENEEATKRTTCHYSYSRMLFSDVQQPDATYEVMVSAKKKQDTQQGAYENYKKNEVEYANTTGLKANMPDLIKVNGCKKKEKPSKGKFQKTKAAGLPSLKAKTKATGVPSLKAKTKATGVPSLKAKTKATGVPPLKAKPIAKKLEKARNDVEKCLQHQVQLRFTSETEVKKMENQKTVGKETRPLVEDKESWLQDVKNRLKPVEERIRVSMTSESFSNVPSQKPPPPPKPKNIRENRK